jgi:hypothetical protein
MGSELFQSGKRAEDNFKIQFLPSTVLINMTTHDLIKFNIKILVQVRIAMLTVFTAKQAASSGAVQCCLLSPVIQNTICRTAT